MQKQYHWWVLAVSTVTQIAAALSTQGFGVLAGFLQISFGLSNSEVGLLASVLNIAPIFGLFLIGKVLDVVGERTPVAFGMCIISIGMLLIASTYQYATLMLALFFCGVGYSSIQPGGSKAVYSYFPEGQRGLAMGIRQAAIPIGGALAAGLFPLIIMLSSWRVAVLFAALLVLVSGILFLIVYRNLALSSRSKGHPLFSMRERYLLLKQPAFRRILRIGFVLVGAQTVVLVFWMLFIHNYFHISLLKCARYLFVAQISGAIGRIVLSTISDHIKNGRYIVLYTVSLILFFMFLSIAFLPKDIPSYVIMIISCLLGFLSFGWYGPWVVWLSGSLGAENVGMSLGLGMALNQTAIVLSPLLFGILLDTSKAYQIPWLSLAACLGLMCLKDFVFQRRNIY